jgi:hypothetical protein
MSGTGVPRSASATPTSANVTFATLALGHGNEVSDAETAYLD